MKKQFSITTAINYTNGPPHIGHFFEAIIADVIARFHRINGDDVFFLTGTDEHGLKIAKKAEEMKLTPMQLCDYYVKKFKDLNQKALVSNDYFVRTTDKTHKEYVHTFYNKCLSTGDIYLGEYEGWYNVKEETFVTNKDAESWNYKDPITHTQLTKIKEPSYFFKLSKYQQKIIDLHTDGNIIYPESKRKEILTRLQEPLHDLSISRTSFDWGIPIVSDSSHVLYVWFDALLNYISASPEKWPTDVHIIGKDILWFHAVIWPAMLMSANMELPKKIYAHGFVTDAQGIKMSKSLGNVVNPYDLLDKYPISAIRYYLIKEFNYNSDIGFSEQRLVHYHDHELLATLGNYINRCMCLAKGQVPEVTNSTDKVFDLSVKNTIINLISQFKLQDALMTIYVLISKLNEYLNDKAPWKLQKNEREEKKEIVKTSLEGAYIIAHLLHPIIPGISETICCFLNTEMVTLNKLSWNNLEPGRKLNKNKHLFTIIDKDSFEKRKKRNEKK